MADEKDQEPRILPGGVGWSPDYSPPRPGPTTSPLYTLADICIAIEDHMDRIFIRECVDEKWGSYALSELPAPLAIKHTVRLIREGRMPLRTKEVDAADSR